MPTQAEVEAPVDETAEIQAQMARIRRELHEGAEDIAQNAREMVDWKHYVRQFPWAAIGVAAAAGYMVVPRRLHVIRPDARTLEKMAKRDRLVIKQSGGIEEEKRAGLGGMIFGLASSMMMRSLMTYVGGQAGKLFGDKAAEDTDGVSPSPSPYAESTPQVPPARGANPEVR